MTTRPSAKIEVRSILLFDKKDFREAIKWGRRNNMPYEKINEWGLLLAAFMLDGLANPRVFESDVEPSDESKVAMNKVFKKLKIEQLS
jgi:hypothetical protein